jgi:hypothetical protein
VTDYRYTLERGGWLGAGRLCWVMLNPSTADDSTDDPTIRRVVRFTRDAGYSDLVVVNLFAARSTNPKHLLEMDDPIGPRNDTEVRLAMRESDAVVFAWGSWYASNLNRFEVIDTAAPVRTFTELDGLTPACLGTTKDGAPRHPLYVSARQSLVPYRWPAT